jgi:hypothetical protein
MDLQQVDTSSLDELLRFAEQQIVPGARRDKRTVRVPTGWGHVVFTEAEALRYFRALVRKHLESLR